MKAVIKVKFCNARLHQDGSRKQVPGKFSAAVQWLIGDRFDHQGGLVYLGGGRLLPAAIVCVCRFGSVIPVKGAVIKPNRCVAEFENGLGQVKGARSRKECFHCV